MVSTLKLRGKVVILSAGQPSATPRLIKEAKTLYYTGFDVSVLYCPTSPWADIFDKKLFSDYPKIHWIKVGYHSKHNIISYTLARVRRKVSELLFSIIGDKFRLAEYSLVLFNKELEKTTCSIKADLYIGHNIGTLSATVAAAKKYRAKAIFDLEDYHRGEHLPDSIQSRMIIFIENKYLPNLCYATAASPLIMESYKMHFPDLPIYTIQNTFPRSYAQKNISLIPEIPLKLFWFSQHIGMKRGLETVIESMSRFAKNEITLTLLGAASHEIKIYFQSLSEKLNLSEKQLLFLNPVSENEIVQIASQHHIGLASEYAHNVNRDFCLTNKIFTYLLAGNALVLSDTHAQKYFLSENPSIGSLYEQNNAQQLTFVLKNYIGNSKLLSSQRQNALELAKTKYNWDIEQYQFLDNVKSVLTS